MVFCLFLSNICKTFILHWWELHKLLNNLNHSHHLCIISSSHFQGTPQVFHFQMNKISLYFRDVHTISAWKSDRYPLFFFIAFLILLIWVCLPHILPSHSSFLSLYLFPFILISFSVTSTMSLAVPRMYDFLVPWPGIKPTPPALEAQSLKYWTAREVP